MSSVRPRVSSQISVCEVRVRSVALGSQGTTLALPPSMVVFTASIAAVACSKLQDVKVLRLREGTSLGAGKASSGVIALMKGERSFGPCIYCEGRVPHAIANLTGER